MRHDTGTRRAGWWAIGLFCVGWAATWWDPRWPVEQALHNSLTVLALAGLVVGYARRVLPTSSLLLGLGFLTVHVVAARWIYSFVPYDDWSRVLSGVSLSETFGWERNHFDRLVHACYGACVGPIAFGLLVERRPGRDRWAALRAVEIVLSTSAFYELFEFGVALTLAPDATESYVGQQGDVWDPHRDIALAVGCAIVTVSAVAPARRRRARPAERAPAVTQPG
ncbi:hypothetical protein Val02_22750 [Virgisporangium aliadipatigenens]|uniref:DUF2238 domain-containing protein n=1 Tax=Virgisporangium aliadipatigenens TaxID=741659 RepID=A0A8J3YHI6_9ACTN|nr:DUF2238 domain-containing protein [Virgisporangium aliadipatigenens]GIJ45389.1 hypothetical protein Val02_22750 [Virgisporangium aliadipatigenens]